MLRTVGRAVGCVVAVGILSGGAITLALPASAEPPNCSIADFEGVTAGVSASMSAYLFSHPDVNAFLSGLVGRSREDAMTVEKRYYERNPGVQGDLTGIRQPLTDLRARCGDDPTAAAV